MSTSYSAACAGVVAPRAPMRRKMEYKVCAQARGVLIICAGRGGLCKRMAASPQVFAPAEHRDNYRWWVIAMLWLVCFFNYADRQSIYSIFPTLSDEFGFSKVQLGIIGSAFMW